MLSINFGNDKTWFRKGNIVAILEREEVWFELEKWESCSLRKAVSVIEGLQPLLISVEFKILNFTVKLVRIRTNMYGMI